VTQRTASADEGRWYGWETIVADSLSLGVAAVGVARDSPPIIGIACVGLIYASPVIDAVHGHDVKARVSLILRLATIVEGALFIFGDRFDAVVEPAPDPKRFEAGVFDVTAGILVAIAIVDATVGARVRVAPTIMTPAEGHAIVLGIAGRF
jgi:hypothetical protein